MQKQTFAAAIQDATKRLRISDWVGVLSPHFESAGAVDSVVKEAVTTLVFETQRALVDVVSAGGATSQIVRGYGLHEIMSESSLADLLTTVKAATESVQLRSDRITRIYYGLREFEKTAGATLELIGDLTLEATPELLVLEVPSEEALPVDVLVQIVLAVADLHDTLARHLLHSETRPAIAFLDSGSPVTIGFSLDGKIVTAIKEAIIEVLEYARFWRNRRMERDVETAIMQIDLIREIEAAEASKDLDNETAARLRQAVSVNLLILLRARALPREFPLQVLDADVEALAELVPPLQLKGPGEDDADEDAG